MSNNKYLNKDMIDAFLSLYNDVLNGEIYHVMHLDDGRVILTGGKEYSRHLYLQTNKGEPRIFSMARPGLTHCFFVDDGFVVYEFLQAIAEKGFITLPSNITQ
ncbi:hypothetical protein J6Z48_03040 [bacterium]|nr:hypothetical protein [bacterium]